jgi:hypothetical protein
VTSIGCATLAIPSMPRREPKGAIAWQQGAHVPPLVLDDDEAVAVAVGLRYAAGAAIGGMEESSLRALTKVECLFSNPFKVDRNRPRQALVRAPRLPGNALYARELYEGSWVGNVEANTPQQVVQSL